MNDQPKLSRDGELVSIWITAIVTGGWSYDSAWARWVLDETRLPIASAIASSPERPPASNGEVCATLAAHASRTGRGNIRGNVQIVHCLHSVQKRGRSGRCGGIGRI
jgi:hypothetical protein